MATVMTEEDDIKKAKVSFMNFLEGIFETKLNENQKYELQLMKDLMNDQPDLEISLNVRPQFDEIVEQKRRAHKFFSSYEWYPYKEYKLEDSKEIKIKTEGKAIND